jgi:competence protein ComEC
VRLLTFPAAWVVTSAAMRLPLIAELRGRLFLLVPLCLGLGIGGYFSLLTEPDITQWSILALSVGIFLALAWVLPEDLAPVAIGFALIGLGAGLAGARTQYVAAPVLTWRYYGPIEGRIQQIDRSASDAVRITLDQVVLDDVSPSRTPAIIRISLHGEQGFATLAPGARIMMTGHLSPPAGPVEPGGFDFRRLAWFARLGAVGYTRSPAVTLAPPQNLTLPMRLNTYRLAISSAVQARITGESGAFVAALLTGDRSGIGNDTVEHLRRSNLSHLLAISGLHMGLVAGFVFATVRLIFAFFPYAVLRLPTQKIAAVSALIAASGYLALSGGNLATERAFIMVALMLGAILCDRRAISLRSVALAAIFLLLMQPEALLSAGFQMSFAATTALVAVFNGLRDQPVWQKIRVKWARGIISVLLCSLIAGLATAPISAAQFHRIAEYGLLANLLAVPMMGLVIVPAGVFAVILTPLGLENFALNIMKLGADWILFVSSWVADIPGSVTGVRAPPTAVLPMLAVTGFWAILWPGRARWAGAAISVAVLFLLWVVEPRPQVLISDTGGLIGVLGGNGLRALSQERANGFAAENWLGSDGDTAPQLEAHNRLPVTSDPDAQVFMVAGSEFVHLTGRNVEERLPSYCRNGRIIVLNHEVGYVAQSCTLITPLHLRHTGALAYVADGDGLRRIESRTVAGDRPWSRPNNRRSP